MANYTATGKWRKKDDYTLGGINNKRLYRAVIVYTNLIKKYFKTKCPIDIGGLEASFRCICHYDLWSDKLRRSVLFDAKADYLVYGMGEKSVVKLAESIKNNTETEKIRGLCYISEKNIPNILNSLHLKTF